MRRAEPRTRGEPAAVARCDILAHQIGEQPVPDVKQQYEKKKCGKNGGKTCELCLAVSRALGLKTAGLP